MLLLLAAAVAATWTANVTAPRALAQHNDEPISTGGTSNPFRNDPQAIVAGAELFRVHCSACHGERGEGGSAPALAEGIYGIGNRDEDLRQVVMWGRNVMRGFRNILPPDSIWQVVAYVRSLSENKLDSTQGANAVAGDAAAGEKIFWGKGGCGQCHRVGVHGSYAGPNLSVIGTRRGAAYLRESLLDPNASVPPGYAQVRVVTADGQTVQGIRRRSDNFSVQFFDMQGAYHSYLRDAVREITESEKSLMPAYGDVLSKAELNDLVAYLSMLGRDKRP